jgi:NAD(P)-dependent dehydrogenase (short-subunit alcohol dehydrogenase family)
MHLDENETKVDLPYNEPIAATVVKLLRSYVLCLRFNGWLFQGFEDAKIVRHGFPMGHLGTADEVADVIVFIASPRARWINGRNIPVDGLERPYAPLDRRPS